VVSALWRKLGRDLWQGRGQGAAIALVVACAVGTSAGATATARALARSRDLYYQQAAMPDLFAWAVRAPAAVAGRIAALPGVAEVETRAAGEARLTWPGGRARIRLVSVDAQGGRLGRLHLRAGRLPGAGEAALSEGFALANRLGPGDAVELTVNGRRQRVVVSGVALSPEHVYAVQPGAFVTDDRAYGLAWVPRRAAEAALDLEGAFDEVVLTLAPGGSLAAVTDGVDRLLRPSGGLGAVGRDRQLSHRYLTDEIRQQEIMAAVLPAIFLGVAAFLVSVALSRLVTAQRAQIGTLKALGYGDLSIGLHYAAYAGAITLAGAAAGAALGHGLGAWMARVYTDFYRFPVLDYRADPGAMLTAGALALAAGLAGAAAAVLQAVRLPPAEAMRPPAPGRFRRTWLERLGAGALLSLPARAALRGLARRPLRGALGTVGLASAAAVLVAGAFFGDAVDFMIQLALRDALRADATVTFSRPASPAAVLELARLPGVLAAEPLRSASVELRRGARRERVGLQGTRPGAALTRLVGQDGRVVPVPEDGLVVSARLAEQLGARPGDPLEVELLEGRRTTRTLTLAATVDDLLGLQASASLATLRALAGEGDAFSGAQLAVDPARRAELAAALDARPGVGSVSWRADSIASLRRTLRETFLSFAAVLVGFAVAIAGGVVYSTVRASFAERSRELATLRVIGYTRTEAWRVLLGEVVLQLAAALPLGVLLGLGLAALAAGAFQSDLFRIPLVVSRSTLLLAVLVTAFATLATALVARRWLDRLAPADALRTGE